MKHAAIRRKFLPNLCALLALAMTSALVSHGADVRMERVGRGMLCVTEGSVEGMPGQRLDVNVSKMRAYCEREDSSNRRGAFQNTWARHRMKQDWVRAKCGASLG
jgi:hypothetical protein